MKHIIQVYVSKGDEYYVAEGVDLPIVTQGKTLDELVENIRNFAKSKRNECEFGINFVVSRENANSVYASAKFFSELGVNHVKITPVWIKEGFFEYHAPLKESVMEQIARAKRDLNNSRFKVFDTYENDFETTGTSKRTYPRCYMMQMVPVIGADSNVYFCHDKAYANDGILGSIKDQSFKELWFSEEAKKIFNTFNPIQGCQHHCTGDLRNKLVTAALDSHGKFVNFI